MKDKYKTLVISDLHLGSKQSKAKELIHFLRQVRCETLILNGNIIDYHAFIHSKTWKKKYSRFYIRIFKLLDEHKIRLIYLPGEKDRQLFNKLPIRIGNVLITRAYQLNSGGKKYLVSPGNFYYTVDSWRLLSNLGRAGYWLLLKLHRFTTHWLKERKPLTINRVHFEQDMISLARLKNCEGVICGHCNQPEIKELTGIKYLNSGDWIEKMSALAETHNGKWHLIYYSETGGKKGKFKDQPENLMEGIHQEVS